MSELKNAFVTAFPESASTAEARNRVVEAARAADDRARGRQQRRFRTRLTFGFGVASIALLSAIMLFPSYSSAAYLRHVRQMITDAKSAHMTVWFIAADGSKKKSREIWYQTGKWRIVAGAGETTVTDGVKKWVYDPSQKSVRISPDPSAFAHGPSGFTLASMVNDAGGRDKISIKDEGQFDRATLENPTDNSILTLWVDKKTDLPVRGEIGSKTPNGMELDQVIEFEFNKPIEAGLFAADFGKGVKVVDESAGERYWQRELSKTLAVIKTIPGAVYGFDGKLVIRDLQVTDSGDVYVLYSGQLDQRSFALKDSLGNEYTFCEGFQPEMQKMVGEPTPGKMPALVHDRGILVDGGILSGAWFTPLSPQTKPWKARKLEFVFTQHGYKVDPEKAKTWPKNKMVKQSEMIPVDTPLGSWNWTLPASTCGLVPDYMPYMGMGPRTEFDVQKAEDEARFQYLHFHERYAEAEPYLRDEIKITDAWERANGARWVQTQSYYMMYMNLKLQGRHDEAVTWLKKVLDEPGGPRSDGNIQKALQDEGLG